MKNFHFVRSIVITVALFAVGTSSLAQSSAQTAAGVTGPALTDYAPVLQSALDRAWTIDPEKGVETREVADGVFVIMLNPGGTRIELQAANSHSDEGDTIVYIPRARFQNREA